MAAVRNGLFNPESVGAEAKQKLLFDSIVTILKTMKNEPTDEYIRFLLRHSEVGSKIGNLTQRIVDLNRDLVKSAIEAFVAQEALARLGFEPKDVVRTPAEAPPAPNTAPVAQVDPQPSQNELKLLQYVKNRIYFLVKDDKFFNEVEKIDYRKSKSSFRIFYSRPNSGSLLDYWETREGKTFVSFPVLGGTATPYAPTRELDESLTKAFYSRVKDDSSNGKEPPAASDR